MSAIKFGISLLKLHAGADFSQVALNAADHNSDYRGRKMPLSVTISCTNRCNLTCIHCQSENDNLKEDISTERFLKLIDEIAEAGATKVGFTGGEPLMRKDMPEILKRCFERKLVTSMVSNAWMVKQKVEHLKGLNLLFLSLDGNEKVMDEVRGPGNFAKFLEAVEAAKQAGVPVCALTTLMSNNFGCVEEMAELMAKLKIHWMVGLIQSGFTQRTEQDLKQQQLRHIVSVLRKSPYLRTSKGYIDSLLDAKPLERCYAGIGYCIIAPNGMLYPCFPAQFDHENYKGVALMQVNPNGAGVDPKADYYKGVSILDKPFGQAFREMKLYRRTCDSCGLACHAEANELYEFGFDNIRQSFKLMAPAA